MLPGIKTLTITTPEGISFSLQPAGPVSRMLAWLVDWAGMFALLTYGGILFQILGMVSLDLAIAAYVLAYFFLVTFYRIILETFWNGQTLGKRLFGLRVTDIDGLQLSFSRVAVRNILRAVDGLPFCYMVGGIVMLFNPNSQRLGDIAAGTVVIKTGKVPQPELDQILSDKYNSLRRYPDLCARIRRKTTPELARITLEAMVRRNILEPDARIQLFKALAGTFQSFAVFPEEAVQGLSDEQYVRNIFEILFNPH